MLALVIATPAFAATRVPTNAGQTLQQMTPSIQAPQPSRGITLPAPQIAGHQPGGTQITLKTVHFTGNTLFTDATLLAVLGNVGSHSYDFAGLARLAEDISAYYQTMGYPFSHAFLPAQTLEGGVLTITVVEGRYGTVKATGDKKFTRQAEGFLIRLKPHSIISNAPLERAILLLEDQPGIRITPIIRPGEIAGTGDLNVFVHRNRRITGTVGLDNDGSRYTGKERAHIDLGINSPFLLGDRILLTALYTDQSMWLGSFGYQLPLGGGGLRANIGYSRVNYRLGKEFTVLDATGYAKVATLGVNYSILRSQEANLTIAVDYRHKALQDKQGVTQTRNNKSSNSLSTMLDFNLRDGLIRGGMTYGTVIWTAGQLNLDSGFNQLAIDQATAKTAGHYNKVNLDMARIQALSAHFSLFGRIAVQWTDRNLDSSESFGLGGVDGVRAYPVDEGYGDEGWLAQLELRYTAALGRTAWITPYAFYDNGRVRINRTTWNNTNNHRSIGGIGLGLRASYKKISADVSVAWRTHGGNPVSSPQHGQPRVWASVGTQF